MTAGGSIQLRELERMGSLPEGLPVVLVGDPGGMDPPEWIRRNKAYLNALLHRNGAVVLRDFGVATPRAFSEAAHAASETQSLMDYLENTSPRTRILGHVMTSTDYSADKRILPHNEHSYSQLVPQRLFFMCMIPATTGGRTTLADCRRVLARVGNGVAMQFEAKGWMYVRNFRSGFGPSWQDVFDTTSIDEVIAYCQRADIQCEYRGDGSLTIRHVRRATVRHPHTAQQVWFNHIAFWNVASLEPMIRNVVLSELSEEDYPNQTYYGDGTPIEPGVIDAIHEAYNEETVGFDWREGDVMIVDNILVAHGREPFEARRLILFAMADPVERRLL